MAYLDFIEVVRADPESDDGYWAVIEGRDGKPDIVDNCFDTPEQAEAAGRAFKAEYYAEERMQQLEIAREVGAVLGCSAYNECLYEIGAEELS